MRRRDRSFLAGASALTLLVPGLLAALAPFGEPRATFGTLSGWLLVLLVMVPSWFLLSRGADNGSPHALLRSVMGGMLLRLALTVGAVTAFVMLVADPPLRSFLLAFFLGYALFMALELRLVSRGGAGRPQPKPEPGEVRA